MNKTTRELILIALFPALMGATAGIAIPLGSLPSITLQTIFVFLAGLLLKPTHAGLSMVIYLIIGAIGIPIFANYTGGIGIILGKSGGFLIGFVLAAILVGFMKNVKIINNDYLKLFLILFIVNILIYMIGASYMAVVTNTDAGLILKGLSLYLPGDILKIIIVIYVYVRIRPLLTYEAT